MHRCYWIVAIVLSILPFTAAAETEHGTAQTKPPAQLLMLGSFHFANPQADVVKSKVLDVTSAASQAALDQLTTQLMRFQPTRILLEYDPESEDEINQRYQQYRAQLQQGMSEQQALPGVNEIYQIGFRLAARVGLQRLYSVDEREAQWQGEALFEYLETQDASLNQQVQEKIRVLSEESEALQTQLNLTELLRHYNSDAIDRENQAFYLFTNAAGVPVNRVLPATDSSSTASTASQYAFVGADAAASWWRRNFRMYALVQAHAQAGERVLVLAGQGHTAILKSLARLDSQRVLLNTLDYL